MINLPTVKADDTEIPTIEICEHDWVYKPNEEPTQYIGGTLRVRQKRICKKCLRTERQGHREIDKYFYSVFAAPPSEIKKPEVLVKLWGDKTKS